MADDQKPSGEDSNFIILDVPAGSEFTFNTWFNNASKDERRVQFFDMEGAGFVPIFDPRVKCGDLNNYFTDYPKQRSLYPTIEFYGVYIEPATHPRRLRVTGDYKMGGAPNPSLPWLPLGVYLVEGPSITFTHGGPKDRREILVLLDASKSLEGLK